MKILIYSILISTFLFIYCDKESTNADNHNISQGTITVSGDYTTTLKYVLTVNNIVLYYDNTRVFLGIWEFDEKVLDSTKSVTLNGNITTDLSGFE